MGQAVKIMLKVLIIIVVKMGCAEKPAQEVQTQTHVCIACAKKACLSVEPSVQFPASVWLECKWQRKRMAQGSAIG
jgi:hypothetical protein